MPLKKTPQEISSSEQLKTLEKQSQQAAEQWSERKLAKISEALVHANDQLDALGDLRKEIVGKIEILSKKGEEKNKIINLNKSKEMLEKVVPLRKELKKTLNTIYSKIKNNVSTVELESKVKDLDLEINNLEAHLYETLDTVKSKFFKKPPPYKAPPLSDDVPQENLYSPESKPAPPAPSANFGKSSLFKKPNKASTGNENIEQKSPKLS